jgi:hypothetical protein
MENYLLTLNQFAKFTSATSRGKERIVEGQKFPKEDIPFWYQGAKAGIKQFFKSNKDLKAIQGRIEHLKNQDPDTETKRRNRDVSIEALTVFAKTKLPEIFHGLEYEVIKPPTNVVTIHGVEIKVTPEVVIRAKLDNKVVIGGIKFHIAKKAFKREEAKLVGAYLQKYLTTEVAGEDEVVLPQLCFCLDVFGKGLISAPSNGNTIITSSIPELEKVKNIWEAL